MSLVESILKKLDEAPISSVRRAFPSASDKDIQSAVKSLSDKNMVEATKKETDIWTPSVEGEFILEHGSHEFRVYQEVCKSIEGIKISDLKSKFSQYGPVGQKQAFKNKWIRNDGDKLVKGDKEAQTDETQSLLKQVISDASSVKPDVLKDLKKRKLVTQSKIIDYSLAKGPEFSLSIQKLETDLTMDMLQSGSWKEAKFKPYNFDAQGTDPEAGALHPLNKVREEFRLLYLAMGFTEMATDPYVETGFWNFDALFVPQQHPARDLQDTFYIKDPKVGKLPEDAIYFEHVRNVHQNGEFGSIGYRYPWKENEATRLVLRTHTTSVSARMLHQLAKDPKPARYFSIDRVFRNEAVDATHLAEFHQIEGVIADYGLTLGDLIGFMQEFFSRMGVQNLRFKPAYNPYTEPSLEIFGYHNQLNKWVEIGNSGLFRPEMLEAMGLPKDFRVIGYGLSLERPTMIKYGVANIRDLLGHKVSLDFVENNPAVRFDQNLV